MAQSAVSPAGTSTVLYLNFYDETTGLLVDPDTVQLDITYGGQVGFADDYAGPFTYQGATGATAGQVWRQARGKYAYAWPIPAAAPQGVYVANWTCTYGGGSFLGVENITVGGSLPLSMPAGDVGFWTGGLTNPNTNGIYGASIEFGQVDEHGIAWMWKKIDGWDSPDVQGAGVIARSGDHGGWASPQYFAPRTLTWTVHASAPDQATRDLARTLLQRAVPVSGLATLRYDEPVPKYALVRRSGKVTEAYPTLTDVTFTVGLVAPDPRKYAVAQRAVTIGLEPPDPGGGLTVPFTLPIGLNPASPPGESIATNGGSFDTPPVAVITGPVVGPTLSNVTTNQTLSWSSLTLGTADVLVVDFLTRQAYVNPVTTATTPGMASAGGTYWPADVNSSWWQLAPGDNEVGYGGTAGIGSTTVFYWRDTWI
ncbi:hypothetical protein EDD90_2755 [Streptomyces sp. Ag109_O5-1]|uniref:phage distal tail protein n=1 Tax=Streptomyces sp. Ag109_O5-1 TaxID=1938851 RepID=UPI000F508684|nr:hypothetical protein [Streptomyces sp. Ag109_O5-1]RPE39738.1 hypothetical protein EDD90_2755 [Streptomyces sp. Ag109_O5-1]